MKRFTLIFLYLSIISFSQHLQAQTWPPIQPEAKAGTRWWWPGSAVDKANLQWNLNAFAKAGIGSVEVTPIYGVQGGETRELPYLSAQWLQAFKETMESSRQVGITVDMNCGTGWPFGGPWIPIEEAACKALFVVDTVATGTPLRKGIDPRERPYARLLVERRYPLTSGKEQVVQLYQSRTRQMVKRAAPGGEGWVVDHFDRDAVARYLQHIGNAFDHSGTPYPNTLFNDSYEVYGANWTPTLFDEFARRRGYRLEENLRQLLGLVDDGNKVLSDYRETLSDLLLENFTQQWTVWAHNHGAKVRNQAHGSPANLLDLYGAVDIPETEGFGLSDFGIKGLRTDAGMTRRNYSDVSMLKYASSAAHVMGHPLTSSETFTWLTEHFRTSLSQMKPDLDLLFTCGINHVLFHGSCYTPQDAPWPGWRFYASVDMTPMNSIWRDVPYLTQYIERCQSFLQLGQPDNDFLVYLPMRDMWRQRLSPGQGGLLMQFDIHSMAQKAPRFIHSILRIDSLGYDCDYISDRQLQHVSVSGDGFLLTQGGTQYRGLIVPDGTTLTPELQAELNRLSPLVIYGEQEQEMARLAKAESMRKDCHLRVIRRKTGNGHHYFIANLTPNDIDAIVPLAVNDKSGWWFNPMTGSIEVAEYTQKGFHVRLRSGESRILQVTNLPNPETTAKAIAPATIQLQGPWRLSFIESVPSIKRTYKLKQLQTWENLDDSTRILMGTGVYTTTFRMEKSDITGPWELELGDVRESARVYLNGKLLGCAWAVPFTLPCGNALKAGKNELRIEVTNLPANRIADMDRKGIVWRKMKDINVVDLNYRPTSYAHWTPMPSGLNSPVRLVKR
ncbi:MAG: glycosyl hydrolase family 2 [Bacteroidaceae bacterium]|nr:glycosyl hydrolase family 2 [Bacteroidaceae bacterium]